MTEIARLRGCGDWIDLGFVERERKPVELIERGIRLHLARLSLSNTVTELERFGVQRSRKAVQVRAIYIQDERNIVRVFHDVIDQVESADIQSTSKIDA